MVGIGELAKYSLEGMRYRKLRSWLTILGVVIGIAAIVVLVALAQGLDRAVREQITSMGTNFIQVMPGSPESAGIASFLTQKGALYQKDADSIRRVSNVEGVSAIVSPGFATFIFKNSTMTAILAGIEPDGYLPFIRKIGFEKGDFLKDTDKSGIVIGNGIAKNSFKDKVEVGKIIYVNDLPFKVKGILKPSVATDSDIYVTIPAARQFISDTEDPDRIYAIIVVTREGEEIKPIASRIERIIANNHRVSLENRDFNLITADSILDAIGVIFGLLTVFLGMVAFISLIVGSIGIANSMYTSVMERTREIGILKAIGASNGTITGIFLLEAGIIGIVGGAIGIIAGILLTEIGKYVAKSYFNTDLPIDVSLGLVAMALIVSLIVGILAGYFPSRKAERMEPVEALGYE
ncbi:MAG TPA: ABC transporter permease [Candidatus Norongarragalinales archaeon]|nr:ABC transporter permease [Candidatus Norongarragalinales archaeon]